MTAESPVLRLIGAGKRYIKYEDNPTLLTSITHLHPRARRSRIWAVRNCDLEVQRGESVGVMGFNGSGKSTLLQMIAGVTAPSEGSVQVRGRVAPLIEVGVGFHPELTGRDNVYVNATILGLRRAEIDRLFDAIVDFSELADFIDTPVKFYSSGMYVRLGFSVAIAVSPDVLLVDEVLAVGDMAFQLKSAQRMDEIRDSGTTMLVVSHNVHLIRRLCQRSLVMHQGHVLFDGNTDDAISFYFHSVGKRMVIEEGTTVVTLDEASTDVAIEMFDEAGSPTRQLTSGAAVRLRLNGHLRRPVVRPVIGLQVSSSTGVHLYTEMFPGAVDPLRAEERVVCELLLTLRLTTGAYYVDAGIADGSIADVVAWSRPLLFHVSGRDRVTGVVDLEARVERRLIRQSEDVLGDGTRLAGSP